MNTASQVILVDEDPAVRSALRFSLELDGFEVETFESAASVVVEALPAAGCLVLDQKLAGLDALELVARLREGRVHTPAVLLATHPNAALRRRAAAAGVAIIEKPILGESLVDGIRSAMGTAA